MAINGNSDIPVLEIENLSISYFTRAGEIPAVVDFSLTLNEGETAGLVGESGCGKSTVAMAIMNYMGGNGGIVGGSIKFRGRDIVQMSPEELRRLRGKDIAMVYQEPMAALNPSMTIGRQLAEVPICHEGVDEATALKRAAELLDAVKLPDAQRILEAYPHQISGGQQQRVVIAMALLSKPSLLLLDEPTTALDVTVEAGIVELIAELSRDFGTSNLYISHNLGLIRETCDRVFVMYSGEVIEEGSIDEVFQTTRHPYTHGLFGAIPMPGSDKYAHPLVPIRGQLPLPHRRPKGCNFGPRCDHFETGRCDAGSIKLEKVAQGPRPHVARCLRWDEIDWSAYSPDVETLEPLTPGERVLRVDEMRKYYELTDKSLMALLKGRTIRYVKANETLSFDARRQQTVAIVGESGCGKSTFAKVLMGLETASEGSIRFNGDDIGDLPVEQRSPEQIGSLQMVFQNPNDTLNPSHTVGGQIARVIRKFGVASDPKEIEQRVLKLLDMVKLPRDFAKRRPRQLSGGQKQRVGIARAFAGNPDMVIADEPVSALDVSVQAAVTQLLMEIQRNSGTTLLFISHDLSVVRYLADRIVVMYLGQIMEQGTTEEVFSPPYHPYTEALLSAVPVADTAIEKRRIVLEGELPSALNPPEGCPFATRCPRKLGDICDRERPPVLEPEKGHRIACHIPLDELQDVPPVFSTKGDDDGNDPAAAA
ncbi:dipeptide ABC transporter ATP-binding protein [Oceanibaculum indicum]|uniref:Oligopeptide/dipeptide ABC transporter ATP-binding protein-like protein n=1 Tax=Oceanibaculum indicum P24 TaxID=1207063 RepID=K2JW54_9PROT|nr:ABC transporter ATP-binding protein [Oceanibaculum indicum]EKE78802.1 oligopeptide/dipeptide ABC transporter ATP-binding protein-like protein [Oceanibaculum indicum P24]